MAKSKAGKATNSEPKPAAAEEVELVEATVDEPSDDAAERKLIDMYDEIQGKIHGLSAGSELDSDTVFQLKMIADAFKIELSWYLSPAEE